MKRSGVLVLHLVFLLLFAGEARCAEEMYIITTSNGSEIVVRDYDFTGDIVEYTKKNGERGSIRRQDFLSIANMIGVTPDQVAQAQSVEAQKKQEILIWIGAAALIVLLYVGYLLYVSRSRNRSDRAVDIHYGRVEKDPATQGHLAFTYRGLFRRKTEWTIDVRKAYEEDSILFIEGVCTTTGKRKIFRADRVVGRVTDKSSDHHAPMADFFVDVEKR
ncbi:MAG: YgdI/YgdR family lipoprotein [Desulfobulbaceae bacterium]